MQGNQTCLYCGFFFHYLFFDFVLNQSIPFSQPVYTFLLTGLYFSPDQSMLFSDHSMTYSYWSIAFSNQSMSFPTSL
jgi:hypothetical protein